MRILFADALDSSRVERLRAGGHECLVEPELGPDDIGARLDGVDVLVVRSTKVTAEAISAGDRLSLVVRAGAGINTIDCQAAADAGIYVSNVPGRNAVAVAELTMGLLLAIDRRLVDNTVSLRAGQWNKREYTKADGLMGKTMAIVGLGSIGLAVAERAGAFGIAVTALEKPGRTDAVEAQITANDIELVDSMEALLGGADVVSVHVPSTGAGPMVDAEFLALLREGAILLNTSRGDVVDEAALLDAIEAKNLRVGLDVWDDEPSAAVSEFHPALIDHPDVIGTHHIGASTTQAQEAIADGTLEVLERFAAGGIENCVNMETGRLGVSTIVVRHLDEVGVLAQVLAVLRANGINVKQMSNEVFVGSVAAVAAIAVDKEPSSDAVAALESIEQVLGVAIRAV
ncbi:MAG: NAD(P)-binding domain-containing protein [Acidimicrobiia bacterium]|nr:NAD(P)-binding domain-containing protein [Acidimicrobiia bacterium]